MSDALIENVLRWFAENGRDLPWRRTYDPYQVWISEVMLQQTQMERGVAYFERWMARLPDIASVAAAGEEEVLKLWEGLGYYSRARNIVKTARLLVLEHGGRLPVHHRTLLKLPGIGPYTAGAIMSLAFNAPYPIVDANIERLFARLFDIAVPVTECKGDIWAKAAALVPVGRARFFNQALMELGALVCTPRNPACGRCPLRTLCAAYRLGVVDSRPVSGRTEKIASIITANGVLVKGGRIFIQKRREQGVWASLWEFPGGRVEAGESPEEAVIREFFEETGFVVSDPQRIALLRHTYTRYRIALHCFFVDLPGAHRQPQLTAAQAYRWVQPEELGDFAFPAPHRRLIERLRGDRQFQSRLAAF